MLLFYHAVFKWLNMKCNAGKLDRAARVIPGVAFISLAVNSYGIKK
jgi:hypothetical protein